MKKVTLQTAELGPDFRFDGISLESQFKNISRFFGIPETLHSVDKKFKTNTFMEVVKAATPTLDVLVADNNSIQVLDPRSQWLKDEEFDSIIEIAEGISGVSATRNDQTFQKQAVIKLDAKDSDSFLGDAFSRSWTITRRAEGGLSFSTDITRLVCTNGMVIPDRQFSGFIRNAKVDSTYLTGFHNSATEFSVDDYLKSLFINNGTPIPCSLGDLMEMKSCLQDLTKDDLADMIFPVDQVQEFYAAQNIDTTTLSRKYLDKLPTGLSYYEALNILTNGAKSTVDKTIDNQIKVAKFCQSKRMQNMKDVDLHWNGMPHFSNEEVHAWMGDVVR